MKNWNKICGIFAIFLICCDNSVAQKVQEHTDSIPSKSVQAKVSFKSPFQVDLRVHSKDLTYTQRNFSTIPANFYSSHLPFFCRQEIKMEKFVGKGVKVRVGFGETK